MKTFFYFLGVAIASFFITANASAQYHRDYDNQYHAPYDDQCRNNNEQSFYYYPQSNVYYSFTTGKYIFPDRDNWTVSERLPRYYRLGREPRFVVYHNGFDVWNENQFHVMKYKDQRRFQPDVAYDHHDRYNNHSDRRDDNWNRRNGN